MMLRPDETDTLRVIDGLNQRGGRMLSLLDLLDAGSLSMDMAAYLVQRIGQGASFLTAARPGGAGKTTVMGALLALVPPGAVLREVRGPEDLAAPFPAGPRPVWHVCHELGPGNHFGYLWGQALPAYFGLLGRGSYLASNLHADTLPEIREALCGSPNGLPQTLLARVDLILLLRMTLRQGHRRHWIEAVLTAAEGGPHQTVFQRTASGDFAAGEAAPPREALAAERGWLHFMLTAGPRALPGFRQRLLQFHRSS